MTAMLWTLQEKLILASGSATRRLMLTDCGIPVDVQAAAIDERRIDAPLRARAAPPREIALALATAKARDVATRHPGRIVLGADQVLDCDGQIFDKAPDRAAAEAHLAAFAGRTHRLTSAACLMRDDSVLFESAREARLTMRPLDSRALALYADQAGAALTRSVGAYEIEGLGAHLFERVEGDHFTIRGLPLFDVLAALRAQGWIAW